MSTEEQRKLSALCLNILEDKALQEESKDLQERFGHSPDWKWYSNISKEKGLTPHCPFASAGRCPKYFLSRSLLAQEKQIASIPVEQDEELLKKWKQSDIFPIGEEEPSIGTGEKGLDCISKFCPEVTYDVYGLFASFCSRFADELDLQVRLFELNRMKKLGLSPGQWADSWQMITPLHYSDCKFCSLLVNQRAMQENKVQDNSQTENTNQTAKSDFIPSEDYRCVTWQGKTFTFTSQQASVVKLLHEQCLKGVPHVSTKSILKPVEKCFGFVGSENPGVFIKA